MESSNTPPSSRRAPERLRKQFTNDAHPEVVLRFEDGHEIHIARGQGKSFDVWPGERVKILARDEGAPGRELIDTKRGEQFPDG